MTSLYNRLFIHIDFFIFYLLVYSIYHSFDYKIIQNPDTWFMRNQNLTTIIYLDWFNGQMRKSIDNCVNVNGIKESPLVLLGYLLTWQMYGRPLCEPFFNDQYRCKAQTFILNCDSLIFHITKSFYDFNTFEQL